MKGPRRWKWIGTVIVAGSILSTAGRPPTFGAGGRSPGEILAEIDKIPIPPKPESKARRDPVLNATYLARYHEAMVPRGELARELLKVDPDNDRLPELMRELWMHQNSRIMMIRDPALTTLRKAGVAQGQLLELMRLPWFKGLTDEINAVIARTGNEKLKIEGAYCKAMVALRANDMSPDALPAIEEFIRRAPKDRRGATLLTQVARFLFDPDRQMALVSRVLADYPDSGAVEGAREILAKLAGVGKPIELEFNDAISGRHVSMNDLRGKVVVIEFWATWCEPCRVEMPKMKRLYEEYHGQGVEFIGISHDRPKEEGGLDQLKAYVAENAIPWPQYYASDGSGGPSIGRGIAGVPAVFVVDREGKLYSVYARGKLETMIPELLKKG